MNIRKANLQDASIVNGFLTKLIHDEKKYDSNINDKCEIKEFYENMISNDDSCILIAEYENKIVGYLYGFIVNDGDTCINLTSKLDALYVEEEYRNKGIANSLIDEFKKWSRTKNIKIIEVSVCNENESAINLYSKHNFKSIKTVMITEI